MSRRRRRLGLLLLGAYAFHPPGTAPRVAGARGLAPGFLDRFLAPRHAIPRPAIEAEGRQ